MLARCMQVAALATILSAGPAMGAPTLLDFEDIAAGTTITAQYGSRGVIFQQAYLDSDPAAHSGTRVLRSLKGGEIFTPKPFVITFTSPQTRVKLFGGSQYAPLNGTLTAYDAGGNVVATDGPRPVPQNTFTTAFEVTVPSASITRVEFQLENSPFESIDDLEFEGEPAAPPPTQPPVVQILSPANGTERDLNQLDITGTVTGDGLLSPVTLTIDSRRPPESTAPPFTSDVDLAGSGTTRQFALAIFGPAPLGPVTITGTAENIAGLKGTGTSTFNNLPAAIRNRFLADGGAATFGDFSFGLFLGDACKIAIYERGAISTDGSASTRVILGDILTKWLSLRTLSNPSGLGCPLEDERDALGVARAQGFAGGRIYAKLPGAAPPGTAYVPAVFVDALQKRGDESNGLPLADPTDSVGPMQTWLFQRFSRPDIPRPDNPDCLSRTDKPDCLLPSTMEIRGSPPVLWMERQAGSWMAPQAGIGSAMNLSDFDRATQKGGATLWESFPCIGNLGPCTVEDEPPFPAENMSNAGALFCGGTTYWPGHPGGPPEWVAIPSYKGDWVATPVFGAIISNFLADIDNALTHEHSFGNCPYCPDTIGGATNPVGGVCPTCPSDYEFKVRPIGPQLGAFPRPSLFGKENTTNIKVEYEAYYASAAHNFLGAPKKGDLVYATGRWIIDCGHSSYKSELHPLFSFATMKTVVSETNAFTGLEEILFGGKPATRAAIWVNGWYTGNPQIEFDLFPPPRPSPDAVLHVVKPVDSAAAQDVTLKFSLVPPEAVSHVHLTFTSPYRENTVTDAGEMMFESGRQYWGKWYLYWGQ
jgi:hypothetical protein